MLWRRARLALIIGGILAAAYFASGWVIGHIAAEKLAGRLRQEFGVELRWSRAWYRMPMGLALHGATVTMHAADGRSVQVFSSPYFAVDLSSLPRASQPVRIASVFLSRPVLSIERQTNGVILHPQSTPRPAAPRPAPGFVIERADIEDATIEYRNDLAGPTVFASIFPWAVVHCSQLAGKPLTFAVHTFPESRVASPRIDAAGSIDTSHRQLKMDHLTIVGPAEDAARMLPSQVANRLRIASGAGRVNLSASGVLGLNSPADNDWAGSFSVSEVGINGISAVPLRHVSVALSLHSSTTPGELIKATIQNADADTGGASLHIGSGSMQADAGGWKIADILGWLDMHGSPAATGANQPMTIFDRWDFRGRLQLTAAASGPYRIAPGREPADVIAHQVLAYPRGVAFRPPGFVRSFEGISSGWVSFQKAILSLNHLHAKYGDDTVLFDAGQLIFDRPHRQIQLTGISSTILFAKHPSAYPKFMASIMNQLRPVGAFGVTGTLVFPSRRPGQSHAPPPDYQLIVSSAGDGQFTLFGRTIVRAVQGSAQLTPKAIVIPRAQGILFSGSIVAQGQITPRPTRVTTFEGTITANNLQLPELAAAVGMKAQSIEHLAGLANLTAAVTDTLAPGKPWYEDLQGGGEFEVYNGSFAALPVISNVAAHKSGPPPTTRAAVSLATGNASAPAPLTVDEAAGIFTLGNRRVSFQKIAISSPILGFEGNGTIGFDKSLDLSLVIAPLGDWRHRAMQANIPIISDVAANVLGAVQKVINLAQGSLINAVHIGGTINRPIIQDTPAPALTNGLASLFGQMLQPHQDHRLLNAVRNNQPTPRTKPIAPG